MKGGRGSEKKSGWQEAWHGTKLQAVYAILWTGGLSESASEEEGERCLTSIA